MEALVNVDVGENALTDARAEKKKVTNFMALREIIVAGCL